jgi:flagellar hook-length control protein FliK
MSPTAPQPIPTAPGGREPISTGAPPGAPPEGPPFQSALENEWARTAIAEGQQPSHSQDPSPADAEQASAAAAFDRSPHGAAPPSRRHAGSRAGATPSGGQTTAGLAPSAPVPAGSAPTPAAGSPGGTATNASAPGAAAGADVNQGLAARLHSGPPDSATARGGLHPSQPESATARGGARSGEEEGAPNASAAVAHDDALPPSPTSSADGAPAAPKDGAPTTDAPAVPKNETPTGSETASALPGVPGNGTTAAAGAQPHSTLKAAAIGDLPTPHIPTSSASSANARPGDLTKTLRASTTSPSTNVNGGGTGELSENTASPLVPAAFGSNSGPLTGEPGAAGYGVGLQEAIESLHGTIQLAARQGLTQARISLQPEELGEIRINLTQTAQGLLARVSAESPAAAQALAAAHAQLRQSLSSLGINLTRLDIGHHDPAQGGGANANGNGQGSATRGEGFAGGRPGRPTAIAAPGDPETEADAPAVEEPAPATTAPSHGTLIDVLA